MPLESGQRVKFYRTHDKTNELIGTLKSQIPDSTLWLIETEVDGKTVEVSTVETADAADITPLEESEGGEQPA